jgi:hypothetical protein
MQAIAKLRIFLGCRCKWSRFSIYNLFFDPLFESNKVRRREGGLAVMYMASSQQRPPSIIMKTNRLIGLNAPSGTESAQSRKLNA